MLPRILFLGENWFGAGSRACCMALRRLRCNVADIDVQTFFPGLRRQSSKVLMRLIRPKLIREYNEFIVDTARCFKPDFLLAAKGGFVEAKTLQVLRRMGISLYNYYPDPSPFADPNIFSDSLFEYDCVFYTKCYWRQDGLLRRFRKSLFVAHGYDPEVHRPSRFGTEHTDEEGHEVAVVATYTPEKEKMLEELLKLMPSLDLVVWGDGWNRRCRSNIVRRTVQGKSIIGSAYAEVLSAARINLALLWRAAGPLADQTTQRTYEIPACGGFMLHKRTPELLNIFREDEEVVCFGSAEEAAAKIKHYLARPAEREAIARAGHARCVPAYSYDNRMVKILEWDSFHRHGVRKDDLESGNGDGN